MAMTYATVTGKITPPGYAAGTPGRIEATPMVEGEFLTFPSENHSTLGPAVAQIGADGTLLAEDGITPGMKIPTDVPAGTVWRLEYYAKGSRGLKTHLGDYEITGDTDVADLVSITPIAITPTVASNIEAAAALGATNDTATASFVNDPGSATDVALKATYAARTHVVVGPGGDYGSLADAYAAHPSGGVDIELTAGEHVLTAPLVASGVSNVIIRGQGRGSTTLTCTAGFIDASNSSNEWEVRDLYVKHAAGTNTDDGIKVDYPRRWLVERLRVEGFGGSSIWYRGGIHSAISFNIISAEDSTGTNGHSGVRVDRSSTLVVPTTIKTRHNYVVGGVQYGLYFERTNVGCTFENDIAELCAVGMRFDTCIGTLIDPYTESNTVAIELHDSPMPIVGRLKTEPTVSWTSIAGTDRYIPRVGHNWINPGKGVIFSASPSSSLDTAASIRAATLEPEGTYTAVPGALVLRTSGGGAGTTLYVKETGTGNTGWAPLGGTTRTTAQFTSAADSINVRYKKAGRQVFNTTLNRPVWATGSAATDTWVFADGTVAHTPA